MCHEEKKKIVYVSHDANFSGAQILSLNIIKELVSYNYDVMVILLDEGILLEEFEKLSPVIRCWEFGTDEYRTEAITNLAGMGYNRAICNTTISGRILKALKASHFKVVTLIHELKTTIDEFGLDIEAHTIRKLSDIVVFPTKYVKNSFLNKYTIDENKVRILPQGEYLRHQYNTKRKYFRSILRKQLFVSENNKIVLGVGYATLRKGIDLFIQVANLVCKQSRDVVFVWVGNIEPTLKLWVEHDVEILGIQDNVFFLGEDIDIGKYYAAADLVLLTSREDPFPTVVHEAMYTSLPVACFKGSGGATEIVTNDTGCQCDYLDIQEMAHFVNSMVDNEDLRQKKGQSGYDLIKKEYNFSRYVTKLTRLLGFAHKKISVIVPNYNYGEFLEKRFQTINNQDYPIYEIIILDDCSTDNSDQIIIEWQDKFRVPVKYIKNTLNSGSVFEQWKKGIETAEGDYIWIAEADDLSELNFLSQVVRGFNDSDVVLSYSQSKQINYDSEQLAENYFYYTNDIDEKHWLKNYFNTGYDEVVRYMSVKNTILNASGVIFKKIDALGDILEHAKNFKIAGDWYFYVKVLEYGKVFFNADSLNIHRRHQSSVTHAENNQLHYNEILNMQSIINKKVPAKYKGIISHRVDTYNSLLKKHFNLK